MMLHFVMGIMAIALMLYLLFLMVRSPHLGRMAWRNLFVQRQTSLLTVIGLAISTALISMTLIASASMNRGAQLNIEKHFGNIAYDLPSAGQQRLNTAYFGTSDIRALKESIENDSERAVAEYLPIVSYSPTVLRKNQSGDDLLIASHVYTLGVDGNEAIRFDPRLESLFKHALLADEAMLSESAAEELEAKPGDTIYILDASNRQIPFKVRQIAKEDGLTGYRGNAGSAATVIISLDAARKLLGINDGLFTNVLLTEKISSDWKAEPVRENSRTQQKEAIGFLTIIFGMTSINSVVIGIVLITNIFKLLAEERRQEMGILRAIGLGRNGLKRLLKIEGLMYGSISGFVGIGAGCGFAFLLIRWIGNWLSGTFAVPEDLLRIHVVPGAIVTGFSIGLFIVFLCVTIISRKSVKISIVEAIQNRNVAKIEDKNKSLRAIWATVLSAIAGVSFLVITAIPDFRREWVTEDRMPIIFLAVLLSVPIVVFIFIQRLNMFCEGMLVLSRKYAGISLVLRISFRNMLANRLRTGLIIYMFAAISCFISFPVVYNYAIVEIMNRSDPKGAIGGYDLIARDARSLDTEQLERQIRELGLIERQDLFIISAVKQLLWKEVMGPWGMFRIKVNGIDRYFAESNDIPMVARDGRFAGDRDVWRELAAHDDYAIVTHDALNNAGRSYKIGDSFPIQIGEKTVTRKIIGIAKITGHHPESYGIWTNHKALRSLAKDPDEIHTTLFVKFHGKPDKKLETALGKSLTLLNVSPVVNIVESENGWYFMGMFIVRLFQGFNVFALAIGMIGLIVVMYRLILQRRHQFGMLRAVGVKPKTIFGSVLMEGSIIGFIGISLGFVTGTYMSYLVFDTLMAAELGGSLSIPIGTLLLFFTVSMALALLFSCFPALKALRVTPIEATRYVG